jgi:hypothetical protein
MTKARRPTSAAHYKAELRNVTKLEGEQLDKLIVDLEHPIKVYLDQTGDQSEKKAAETATWYEEVARAWERLITLAASAPAGMPQNDSALELEGLRHRARLAHADAQLHSVKNPKHRAAWKGRCRDYLARKAKEIIERHCGTLSEADLRRAVAAVLDRAGADYPEPWKNPTKFDAMFAAPATIDLGPDALDARDKELEARREELALKKKLGDLPI